MRANEFTTLSEALSRRGFTAGLLGMAAGGVPVSQIGPTSDGNEPNMATTQRPEGSAPRSSSRAQKYSPAELKDYIITYAKKHLPQNQVIAFIAQMDHESHGFSIMEENLNYSAGLLTRRYPKTFPRDISLKIVNHPRKAEIIANKLYGNRMGNNEPGDGYKYRGRGYIMLTGKANYEKMSQLLNIDLVNNPDLAARPEYAAPIAVTYWKTRVKNPHNIGQVTKNISGNANAGIQSRTEKLKKYTRELGNKVMPKKDSKSK